MQEKIYNLKDLKKGELIKLIKNNQPTNKVYIKGEYDKASKTYSLIEYNDINHEIFRKGNTKVLAGFIF